MVRTNRTSLELGLRGVVRVVQPGVAGIGSTPGGGGTSTQEGLEILGGGGTISRINEAARAASSAAVGASGSEGTSSEDGSE